MRNITYVSDDFVKEDSLQYVLSIRYATDGLSFCVHSSCSKLLVFNHWNVAFDSDEEIVAKLKAYVIENDILSLYYKKVYVVTCGQRKILIPDEALIVAEIGTKLSQIVLSVDSNECVVSYKIGKRNCHFVEILSVDLLSFFDNKYGDVVVVNTAYLFIQRALIIAESEEKSLFVNIYDDYFEVLMLRGGDIMFFNVFKFETAAMDIIYHVLNVLKQLDVTYDDLSIYLSGNMMLRDELIKILSRYVVKPKVIGDAESALYIEGMDNVSPFVYLLNVNKCEL